MFGLSPLQRTLDAALRDLTHKKFQVRLSAVRDLGKLATGNEAEGARAGLLRALGSDEAPGIRAEALVSLADSDSKGALEQILAATKDEHPRVRQMALLALGELAEPGDARLVSLLETLRQDKEPEVRFQALLALHHLAAERAIAALVDGSRDADAEIRHIAFRCAEERWGASASEACPEQILQRARAALRDDNLSVRLAASILLARRGDSVGVNVIADVVNGRARAVPPEDEQAAIELAGELGLGDALRGLARRAFGMFGLSRDSFAWHARIALAQLGDTRAKQALLSGLRAWSRDARTLSVVAVGKARLLDAEPTLRIMLDQGDRADPDAIREALKLLEEAKGGT